MNKKVTVSIWLTSIIIAMAITFSITMMVAMDRFDSTVASVQQKELMYSKISEIDTYVRANNYYDIDETLLQDTIASGYIFGTGDPYAKYYTAEAYTAWLNNENGKNIGVGVEIAKDPATGYAKVITTYAGSPAEDLGIQAGDYLTNIGDIDVKNLSSTAEVEAALLGESGTTVPLLWLDGTMQAQTGMVTRRNYTEKTVAYEMVGSNAYLRVRTFTASTASEIDYALSQLEQQGASAVIFDLRNNSKGDLDYAMHCIALLFGKGIIASVDYGNGAMDELAESYTDARISEPVVCLVNENTTYAAELFAYSARLLSGASVVGTKTAGVGMVQAPPYRFSDGSAVVLTVAKLLTGDGQSFEGVGVAVDVESVLSSEEQQMFYTYTLQTDPQIAKARSVADSLSGVATVEAVNSETANSGAEDSSDAAPDDTESDAQTEDTADVGEDVQSTEE